MRRWRSTCRRRHGTAQLMQPRSRVAALEGRQLLGRGAAGQRQQEEEQQRRECCGQARASGGGGGRWHPATAAARWRPAHRWDAAVLLLLLLLR